MGFLFFVLGLVAAVWPYSAWYVSVGWQLKDSEPSEFALGVHKITGVIGVMIGFVMMISSCSFGGSADERWAEQFKNKIAAGQVQEIHIGLTSPISLNEEEKTEVVNMIQQAELIPFDPGTSYGATNTGTIVFRDSSTVEIVIFGPSGGIELHPEVTESKFKISSDELEYWFRNHHLN